MHVPTRPPPLLAGRVDRRTLLKIAGVGGVFLGLGAWATWMVRGFGPPKPGLRVFDPGEWNTVVAVSEALFPGPPEGPLSAREAGVAEFIDLYVSGLYSDTQQLFRMLIRTLALSTLLSHARVFRYLTLRERRAVLDEWKVSDLRVRRAGYQSLSFAARLGYFEHDRVRAALGITLGCEVGSADTRPDLGRPGAW